MLLFRIYLFVTREKIKENSIKIIYFNSPMWFEKFELRDSSYFISDNLDYIKYIIKKHENLTSILHFHFYIKNRIKNRLLFKINDGHKLE